MSIPVSEKIYIQTMTLAALYNKVEIGTYDQYGINMSHFKFKIKKQVGIIKFNLSNDADFENMADFLRNEIYNNIESCTVSKLEYSAALKSKGTKSIVVVFGA